MLSKDEAVKKLLSIFKEMDESEIDAAVTYARERLMQNKETRRQLDEYFKTHSTQKSRGGIGK